MGKLVSNVVPEKLVRKAQLDAMKLFADTISCTYGPMGGFTAYSKYNTANQKSVVSFYSKDGFTILKNIELDRPIEGLLKEEIRDICTQVIKTVGDGTSSAVILSYYIFKGLLELEQKGYSKRELIIALKEVINDISKLVLERKKDVDLDDIYNIALTSTNGNIEIAQSIKNIYEQYGMSVFIDVQGGNTPDIVIKGYDGMIYDNGFLDPCFINNSQTHSCELVNPKVYVFESPIDTPTMLNIFQLIIQKEVQEPIAKIQQKNPKAQMPEQVLILCPFITRDSNAYLDQLISSFTQIPVDQRLGFCVIANMNDDPDKLVDIMKLTGAKFIKKYIDPEAFKEDQKTGLAPNEFNIKSFAGRAERISIDAISMKIVNPAKMRDGEEGKLTDFFKNYIAELKEILNKYEETHAELVKIGKLKRRINILLGNMVDMYVGGIGTSDRGSLLDSVEDAVLNCRSAAQSGVGYAANFEGLFASSKYKPDTELKITVNNLIKEAYTKLTVHLYNSYFKDEEKAKEIIIKSLTEEGKPFNIIEKKFDSLVLTSIKTEPSILDAIYRIISIIFNTNQFLVPDPRFNIYTQEEDSTIYIDQSKK